MASRGAPAAEPPEALASLGRQPDAHAPRLLRATRVLGRFLSYTLARATLRVEGREHIPSAPYMTACAIHRSWLDALVVLEALPLEPLQIKRRLVGAEQFLTHLLVTTE